MLLAQLRWRGIGMRWPVIARSFAERTPTFLEKYPTDPPNPAVFEPTPILYEIPSQPLRSPLNLLHDVVAKGDWALAARLRDEIVENNVDHIPPDTVFAQGALHIVLTGGDRESFSHWLHLFPSATDNSPQKSSLEPLLTALIESSTNDHILLFHFGQIMAEKGHVALVRQHVLPLFTAASKDELATALQIGLLPLHLEEPVSPPESLFESLDSKDYAGFSATPWSPTTEVSIEDALASAISIKDYDNAETILSDAEMLGVDISYSPVFLSIAESMLDTADVERFERWFGLIPEFHENTQEQFVHVKHRIFRAPVTKMPFVIAFLRVVSKKGYRYDLWNHLDPLRYAEDNVVFRVYRDVQDNLHSYISSLHQGSSGQRDAKTLYAKTYTRFIRFLNKGGRAGTSKGIAHLSSLQAAELFPDHNLVFDSSGTEPAPVPRVERPKNIPVSQTHAFEPKDVVDSSLLSQDDGSTGCKPLQFDNLSRSLLYLRGCTKPDTYVHIWTMLNFYERYVPERGMRAVDSLRAIYAKSNKSNAATLAFAEMLYYFRRAEYATTIALFGKSFYIAGLPRTLIVRVMDLQNQANTVKFALYSKLWPLPVHVALVWQSLAMIKAAVQDVELLYAKLLDACRGQYTDYTSAYVSVAPLIPPPSQSQIIPEAFTRFLRVLMHRRGSTRGVQVLNEMAEVGIEPDAACFMEVAGFAAKVGDTNLVFFILERMEEEWDAQLALWQENKSLAGFVPPGAKGILAEYAAAQIAQVMATQPVDVDVASPPQVKVLDETGDVNLTPPPALTTWDAIIGASLPLDKSSEEPLSSQSNEEHLSSQPADEHFSTEEPLCSQPTEQPLSPDTPSDGVFRLPIQRPDVVPDLFVLYCSVMRGFLIKRDLKSVNNVHERLLKRFDYKEGSNATLENLYADWWTSHDRHTWSQRNLLKKTTIGAIPGLYTRSPIGPLSVLSDKTFRFNFVQRRRAKRAAKIAAKIARRAEQAAEKYAGLTSEE